MFIDLKIIVGKESADLLSLATNSFIRALGSWPERWRRSTIRRPAAMPDIDLRNLE